MMPKPGKRIWIRILIWLSILLAAGPAANVVVCFGCDGHICLEGPQSPCHSHAIVRSEIPSGDTHHPLLKVDCPECTDFSVVAEPDSPPSFRTNPRFSLAKGLTDGDIPDGRIGSHAEQRFDSLAIRKAMQALTCVVLVI